MPPYQPTRLSSRRSRRSSLRSSRLSPRRRTPRVTTTAVPAPAAVRATGRPPRHPHLPTLPCRPANHQPGSRPTECAYRLTTIARGATAPIHAHRWPTVEYVLSATNFVRRDADQKASSTPRADAEVEHITTRRSAVRSRNHPRDRSETGSTQSSVITPRAISITPITPAPITAAVRPLRPIQALNRVDPVLGALRREHVAEQRYLEQDLLHQAEADDQQHGRDGSRVELVDVVQRVEVGDAGEAETAPTTNVTLGSPLPSIRSGSDSVGLPASCLAFNFASFFSRRRSWNGWSRPVPSTNAIATASSPTTMSSSGLIVCLEVLSVLEPLQREDDHQTERDAGRVGAEQVARHQPLRVRKQQHHRHRGEQRRVEHRDQGQQKDVDQIGATARPPFGLDENVVRNDDRPG